MCFSLVNHQNIRYGCDSWLDVPPLSQSQGFFKRKQSSNRKDTEATPGAPLKTYLWGDDLSGTPEGAGGVGGLLAITDMKKSQTHFLGYDGNGNVTCLADSQTGRMTATYGYSPFGQVEHMEGTCAEENPYRFSTKPVDEATGHYYYGYRFYDPISGRWLSRDPIAEDGGINLYGMVGNDAVNNWDYPKICS